MKVNALFLLIFSFFITPFSLGKTMQITIGTQIFEVELTSTQAAQELAQLLPFTLEMQDHLRNEKFAELPQHLTAHDQAVGSIQAGDILLWQGDILVIFYESFPTSYHYTKLGKISDVAHLKQQLGKGNITVHFAKQ